MSTKIIAVCGYGPGVSHAVAERFGKEGFEVALVARTESRLQKGVARLAEAGITAHAFPGDLSDPAKARERVETIGSKLGPITVYHWNALASIGTDLLEASVGDIQSCFNVGLTSFVAGLKPAVAQMQGQDGAAVLMTGGGFAMENDQVDDMIVRFNVLGMAANKAAQHKLVRTLSRKLGPQSIFVGEVIITGIVSGTSFDDGSAELAPAEVAEAMWTLYRARDTHWVTV